jgi:ribose transport system permease protein
MSAVSTDPRAAPVDKPSAWARAGAVQRRFQVVQILALVALFEWGTWTVTDFATKQSVYAMLITASFLGVAGAGQTIVVLVGGIDLSIPAFISLGSIVISDLTGLYHWSFVPALVVIIVVSVLLGGVNGYISHRFLIPPLVVTLGMASIITGALLVWTNGKPSGSPPAFVTNLSLVGGSTFGIGIPPVVFIWVVLAVVLGLMLRRTLAGRHLYATGANAMAADLALVRTRRVWVGAFAVSALIAGLLGVLLAGYAGSGNVQLGDPYLFEGLAAVIVGGTAFGARGDYWRTVLGALVLTVLSTVLVGKGYSNADQQIIFGILILAVVAGYGREVRLRDRI